MAIELTLSLKKGPLRVFILTLFLRAGGRKLASSYVIASGEKIDLFKLSNRIDKHFRLIDRQNVYISEPHAIDVDSNERADTFIQWPPLDLPLLSYILAANLLTIFIGYVAERKILKEFIYYFVYLFLIVSTLLIFFSVAIHWVPSLHKQLIMKKTVNLQPAS